MNDGIYFLYHCVDRREKNEGFSYEPEYYWFELPTISQLNKIGINLNNDKHNYYKKLLDGEEVYINGESYEIRKIKEGEAI